MTSTEGGSRLAETPHPVDIGRMAAEMIAAATGAATERTIGAMLQRLDDGAATMGRIEGSLARMDQRWERAMERMEQIHRELGAQSVRLANLEKAAEARRQDFRSAWTPVVALLALLGDAVQFFWPHRSAG